PARARVAQARRRDERTDPPRPGRPARAAAVRANRLARKSTHNRHRHVRPSPVSSKTREAGVTPPFERVGAGLTPARPGVDMDAADDAAGLGRRREGGEDVGSVALELRWAYAGDSRELRQRLRLTLRDFGERRVVEHDV